MALVPWLWLLRDRRGRSAFWWSWLIGLLFFLGSIWWLIHVTLVGWLLLCAYLAVYFGAFGWGASLLLGDRRSHLVTCSLSLVTLFMLPAWWVALEYARSHVLSGFGWSLLAYSQTPWLPVIQVADLTGAWGVSFLIVLVNVAIEELIRVKRVTCHVSRVTALILVAVLGYGGWRLSQHSEGERVRVAVVQGNVPQSEKWDEAYREKIQRSYTVLTERAAATQPDLIVWPETSVPGYFGVDEPLTQWVMGLAVAMRRPLLVGAPAPKVQEGVVVLTNRAALVDSRGRIEGQHEKLHLVPFGEFVPFEEWLPWLREMLPAIGNFSPGQKYTVFSSTGHGAWGTGRGIGFPPSPVSRPLPPFSVLICFEDIFPELARRFVRDGARLLLVITNDGWFGPTAAAYQHAQASSFRAVELRVPVARAANTGWSGCIDATGRWVGSVRAETTQELFIEGTHTCALTLGATQTWYLRWGDWFAWLCVVFSMTLLCFNILPVKKLR